MNRYRIEEFAGRGGMSVVYRARHEIGDYVVAVKVLDPELAGDPKIVSSFLAEARNTAALRHPSIIRINDVDQTEEGWAYLVMEWLDGRTLYDEQKEHGPLPIERASRLLDKICGAVEHAHGKNVIHRDLKPGNIMLVTGEQGEYEEEAIRILDFGIAKVLDATLGINTQVAGTFYYTSPEQLTKGAAIDRRADIYSLGVVLYQMLTGEKPFEADSMPEMIKLHCEAPPRPLREVDPAIPQAVEDVVLKALAKKPADRYQSATEFARAFRNAANIHPATLIVECVDATDQSRLAGASVYLNGKFVGNTDAGGELRLEQLTPREYWIEVESQHYRGSQKLFKLEPQEDLVVAIKLERALQGSLDIKCNVSGARIKLDGKEIGVTDAKGRFASDSIEAGRRRVRLTFPRHLPAEADVEIEAWRRATLDLTLEPRRGFEWRKIIAPAAVAVFLSLIAYGAYRKWFHRTAAPIVTTTPIVAGNSQAAPPALPDVRPTTNVATNGPRPETTASPGPSGGAVAPTVLPPPSHVSFDALMARAAQSRKARRYQEAVNYYRQALTLRRDDGRALSGLVDAYHDLGGYFLKRGQQKSAADAYQQVLNVRPNDIPANLRLGDAYAGIPENYNKAIEQYNRAINLGFDNPVVYVRLGNIYLRQANYQAAANQCAEAIRRDVKYLEAYSCVHKAFLPQSRGDDKARDFYRKLIDANPQNELAIYHLGLIYVAQRRRSDANAQYNKLQAMRSDWAEKLRVEIARM
ncbi:MAG TPA: protein kinase [Blastocatellia bacterium]|nr:protein kinase [Blastocatellia bacterium]